MMLHRLAFIFFAIAQAHACSVPVFRYALEHWLADPFEAVVFHRGVLPPEQQTLVDKLRTDAERLHANLAIRIVDLDREQAPDTPGQLPWLALRAPGARGASVWSAPFDGRAVAQVLDSPARREIAKRLGEGESAVWLLLESGDRTHDDAAATTLETRLTYLHSTLELPKLEAQDIANGLVSVAQEDLRLVFSTLRLRRDDPEEQAFIKMLLAIERDLAEQNAPVVFPVFGRGRALYALVGDGIKRETIDRAATFLIGKCSCQVKEQNPGADLLLAADWDAAVKAKAAPVPDLPTLAELAKTAPVAVTISGGEAGAPAATQRAQPTRAVLLGLGAVVALLVAVSLRRALSRGK